MKLSVAVFLSLLFSSSLSSAVKVSRKSKVYAYDNICIEAHSRTIFIYNVEVRLPHEMEMEELSRVHTKIPIRSIHVIGRYLFATCRVGLVSRICVWDIENPALPRSIPVKQ